MVQLLMLPSGTVMTLVGLVLMALMVVMLHGHGFFLGHKSGMLSRVIATSAIYQKVGGMG